jgi:hypothetical protein
MTDLVIGLRSLTQGIGFFEWAPNRLEVVPDRLVDEVIAHKGAA